MKKLFLYGFLIFLFSCGTIAKTAYGIKKPRLEDAKSIRKYLLQHSVDTSSVCVFKDLQSFATASERNMLGIPEAMFFNKDGYLVRYKKEAVDCNAKVDGFISDLSNFSNIDPDKSVRIESFLALLDKGAEVDKSAEINVFITWTVYAGKLNKDKAFEWIHLLESAKKSGLRVNYYLVNCDYMKSWNIPKPIQKKLGIKG